MPKTWSFSCVSIVSQAVIELRDIADTFETSYWNAFGYLDGPVFE